MVGWKMVEDKMCVFFLCNFFVGWVFGDKQVVIVGGLLTLFLLVDGGVWCHRVKWRRKRHACFL